MLVLNLYVESIIETSSPVAGEAGKVNVHAAVDVLASICAPAWTVTVVVAALHTLDSTISPTLVPSEYKMCLFPWANKTPVPEAVLIVHEKFAC